MDGLTTLVEKEVIFIKKYIPIKLKEIEKVVPAKYVYAYGRYIPIDFKLIKKYIPVEFKEIEVPIFIPKYNKETTKNLY